MGREHAVKFLEFIDLFGRLSLSLSVSYWQIIRRQLCLKLCRSVALTPRIVSVCFCLRRSLSGCPRARKGGLKLTPNKDDKDEQELK